MRDDERVNLLLVDDRPENLEVVTPREHMARHRRELSEAAERVELCLFDPDPDDAGTFVETRLEVTEVDGKVWKLTLRDGLVFHNGDKVLARDCVASVQRWGKRDAFGQAVLAAADEISAPDDKTIRFRFKQPFALLPSALTWKFAPICAAVFVASFVPTAPLMKMSAPAGRLFRNKPFARDSR